ncbi:MAG: CvpA family protein [Chitinophagaceae bacterium]|jgi:membrane protein required for colicin V production|nr:CvpA family protein [Chitinophagaceae bacterium]
MWLDILTGTLLIVAILQGLRNGLIKAILSFFSFFIGLIVAYQLAGWVASVLKQYTKIESHWLPFISFIIVLLVVLFLIRWVSGLLQQTADLLMLGWLNKLLGIVLYGFIYFTIWSALVYFLQILGVLEAEKMKDAYSYSYLQKWWPYCMEKMSHWLPFIKTTIGTFSNPFT